MTDGKNKANKAIYGEHREAITDKEKETHRANDVALRVQECAKDGRISGEAAFYILNGLTVHEAQDNAVHNPDAWRID